MKRKDLAKELGVVSYRIGEPFWEVDTAKLISLIERIEQLHKPVVGGPASASGSEGEQLGNEAGAQGVCACPHEDPEPSERMGDRVCHICNRDRY